MAWIEAVMLNNTPCLTFYSNTNFSLKTLNGLHNNGTIEYSTDKFHWTTWNGNYIYSVNNRLYLRGSNNTHYSESNSVYTRFMFSNNNIFCKGNIETLLDWETVKNNNHPIMDSYCFYELFRYCKLITAPELRAVELTNYCYEKMFGSCTSLTQAPELPATTLAKSCYQDMFEGCTSLTTAPELPATTLAVNCYYGMFYDCTSLTTAPELLATELAIGCYSYMFMNCTSLTQAPKLPATELANGCYSGMFYNCTSLNYLNVDFKIWNNATTYDWVHGVNSNGIFVYKNGLDVTMKDETHIPINFTPQLEQS